MFPSRRSPSPLNLGPKALGEALTCLFYLGHFLLPHRISSLPWATTRLVFPSPQSPKGSSPTRVAFLGLASGAQLTPGPFPSVREASTKRQGFFFTAILPVSFFFYSDGFSSISFFLHTVGPLPSPSCPAGGKVCFSALR